MTATNRLSSHGQKGILRQMPGLGVGRIVPSTSPSELSAFTQRGAYPGLPVLTSSVSSMFLKVSGTIPEDELPLTVRTLHGGMVGLEEAQWIYSQPIDDDLRPVLNVGDGNGSIDPVRGWEWPNYVTRYEALVSDDAPVLDQPDAVTLSDGRIVQVYQLYDVGVSVTVIAKVRALDGTWTDVTVYSSTNTTRIVLLPCAVVLPDDRVIVYLMNYPVDGTEFQISARVIDPVTADVGDYEVACLKSSLAIADYGAPDETSQLRAAMKPDGTALLLLATDNGDNYRILQLGSYDYGHSFAVVSYGVLSELDEDDTLPDLVYTGGMFVVSYVQAIDGGEGVAVLVVVKTLTHYLDSLDAAPVLAQYTEEADASTARHVTGNALVATPDGILYGVNSVYNEAISDSFGHVHVSTDLGSSWTDSEDADVPNVGYHFGTPGPSWAHFVAPGGHVCAYLRALSATWQGNRLYVGTCFVNDDQASNSNDEGSLVAFYLGGWSNQQKACIDSLAKTSDSQLGYDLTSFMFLNPDFNGWTKTTAGAESFVLVGGLGIINTTDGGKHYYSKTTSGSEKYASVEWSFRAGVFNVMTHGDVGLEVTVDTGAARYKLGLYYLSAGGIRLRDLVAGSTIADIPIDFTDEYVYRLEVSSSKFQLWYRPADSDEDQVWERAIDPFDEDGNYTGYTLTSTTGGSTAAVIWGHLFATTTGATGDAIANWRDVKCDFGSDLATSAAASGIKYWFLSDYVDYASTDDFHNGYPFVAFPVWVSDGVYVTASGGPTYFGDEWEINPAYQYPIANILPEGAAAPGKVWESETDDEDVTVCWLVGSGATDAALADVLTELVGNVSLGLCVLVANFKTASLWGVKSDNTQVKILDVDLTRFSGLTFSNHGNSTRVLAGGGTEYVAPGELVGCYVINSGETTPKRIWDSTEGQLNDDTKSATIRFGASLTETQGVDNDADNCIVGTSGFFVCHDLPVGDFKAYLWKIPAQETAEGRFRCKLLFGPLTVFGIPPAYGFSTTLPQDNVLKNKTNAGHTETRVYNGLPRIKAYAWEALDQTMLDQADPDFVEFAGGDEPVALFDDAARQLYGTMKGLEGANELLVFCDHIPAVTNTGELRPERYMYARATSEFQESNRVGHEGVNELVQITNLVLEEEM